MQLCVSSSANQSGPRPPVLVELHQSLNSLVGGATSHLLRSTHERRLSQLDNLDYCHTLFPYAGASSRALSERGQSRGNPLFLPKALKDAALPTAPAPLTALIFLLLSSHLPSLLLSCLYPSSLPLHSSALELVVVPGSLASAESV